MRTVASSAGPAGASCDLRVLLCASAGFDNIEPLIGYDNNVLNKYFNEYLPRAVSAAGALHCAPHTCASHM